MKSSHQLGLWAKHCPVGGFSPTSHPGNIKISADPPSKSRVWIGLASLKREFPSKTPKFDEQNVGGSPTSSIHLDETEKATSQARVRSMARKMSEPNCRGMAGMVEWWWGSSSSSSSSSGFDHDAYRWWSFPHLRTQPGVAQQAALLPAGQHGGLGIGITLGDPIGDDDPKIPRNGHKKNGICW